MIMLAVSQCLMGDNVRYDGKTKAHDFIIKRLAAVFDIRSICPEVEIGLPVPRNPIQLVYCQGRIRATEVEDASADYTCQLQDHAQKLIPKLADISAYIFKARSPSCGVGTTPVLHLQETRSGVFAAQIMALHPWLPVVDESALDEHNRREQFIEALFCFAAYKKHLKKDKSKFVKQYGLRWALRTGQPVSMLENIPVSQFESVFFTAMNMLVPEKQRRQRLIAGIKRNKALFVDAEQDIERLIDGLLATQPVDVLIAIGKLARLVNNTHRENYALPISPVEYALRC